MNSGRSNMSTVTSVNNTNANDAMGAWASYIDEATGQEYWYNTITGETSWA